MGYRCPVCADPQADDAHLANHLAFTAIVRGGDHEAWLDEHVPDWGDMGEDDLAPLVRDHAEEAEYPAVFEDTTGDALDQDPGDGQHQHGHPGRDTAGENGQPRGGQRDAARTGQDHPEMVEPPFDTGVDEDTQAVIERARELTRKRRENARTGEEPTGDEAEPTGDEEKQ
jgi:hypothetical protein